MAQTFIPSSYNNGSLLKDSRETPSVLTPTIQGLETKRPDLLGSVRDIVRGFLQRASHQESLSFSPPQLTDKLEVEVLKELKELNIDVSSVQRWVASACQVGETLYSSHPMDLKVLIAICNIVIFYIDDNSPKSPEVIRLTFQLNLLTGKPQPDPILECLCKVLIPRTWKHYHPLVANAITIGFYDFIQGTALESLTENMRFQPSAPKFPEYVRIKAGASAPYVFWMFYHPSRPDITPFVQAIPDILGAFDRMNDILSFYKELDGEDKNFVYMRSKISGKDVVTTLEEIYEETLLLIDRISDTLSESPEYLIIFQEFIRRCLRFYTSAPRYRLKELMVEGY